jgi:uncharacterized membrane protein
MKNRKLAVVVGGVAALVFLVLAVVYFTRSAQDLPAFFPGHEAGVTRHHTKHGLAMVGLAVFSVIGGWMLSGQSGAKGPAT